MTIGQSLATVAKRRRSAPPLPRTQRRTVAGSSPGRWRSAWRTGPAVVRCSTDPGFAASRRRRRRARIVARQVAIGVANVASGAIFTSRFPARGGGRWDGSSPGRWRSAWRTGPAAAIFTSRFPARGGGRGWIVTRSEFRSDFGPCQAWTDGGEIRLKPGRFPARGGGRWDGSSPGSWRSAWRAGPRRGSQLATSYVATRLSRTFVGSGTLAANGPSSAPDGSSPGSGDRRGERGQAAADHISLPRTRRRPRRIVTRQLASGVANGATAASYAPRFPARGGRKWGLNRRHWPHRNACFDGILERSEFGGILPQIGASLRTPGTADAPDSCPGTHSQTYRRQSDHLGRCGRIDTGWPSVRRWLSRRVVKRCHELVVDRESLICRTSGLCSCVPPRTRARHALFARSSFRLALASP